MNHSSPKSADTKIPLPVRPQRRWWHEIPMGFFYAPVFLALIAMMVRYRSISAIFHANPGLRAGGLFPESKDGFAKRFANDSALLPKSIKLNRSFSSADVMEAFTRFFPRQHDNRMRFVLKPDDGIQGKAIHILDSAAALKSAWEAINADQATKGDWLLQEYVGGIEAAVFYIKASPRENGRLHSMTWKHGFEVSGNGKHTIGQLIERHDSDEATRKRIRKFNLDRLNAVPDHGEVIDLIPVRNHHLGATFQDISASITPALENAICRELDRIEEFNYGRLDIRVPDFTNLVEGKNIKVLETNALYSEPVHAYDPKYNLRDAYRIFIGHWHQAFLTGLAHKGRNTGS